MYLLGKEVVKNGWDSGVFYKKEDGSVWIDLSSEGLDEKIILRSEGTAVYMTQDSGTAIMGSGSASGENRAQDAIINALDSPLLNDNKISGCKNVLLSLQSKQTFNKPFLIWVPSRNTVCPRSRDPLFIVTYYIKWVTSSWT